MSDIETTKRGLVSKMCRGPDFVHASEARAPLPTLRNSTEHGGQFAGGASRALPGLRQYQTHLSGGAGTW